MIPVMVDKSTVVITESTERDMLELIEFITDNDSVESAEYVLEKIESACLSLEVEPNRGRRVPELVRIGVTTFKQISFKPYRIIYQTQGKKVLVLSVIDGRRDLTALLVKKLLR